MTNISKDSFILCTLDKKTRLIASSNAFVIAEKVKTKDNEHRWVHKYYYSEIGDAIRGYARHVLRRPSTAKYLDGNVKTLIEIIGKLENTIKKIGDKINFEFDKRMQDPIEKHRFFAGDTE